MPKVVFTQNLERHLDVPARDSRGSTVREVLDGVFSENPRLRGYVLDDQGRLRRHVAVFIDGEMIADRDTLADRVGKGAEIYVMQALSGG